MAKKFFTSDTLNSASKAVVKMMEVSPDFKEKVEKYETGPKTKKEIKDKFPKSYGNNSQFIALNSSLRIERSELKNAINSYKSDSKAWILTNGPSGVDK